MKILYVAMKDDYGLPERGCSFEHFNFYDSLLNMGHDILYFDFMSLMRELGDEAMNRCLLEIARAEEPNLMFSVLFKDELDKAVVREISENTETVTLNWFCDDHWRFESFSRHWAPCFNWVVTTARDAVPKYEQIGYPNAIKSQWACNHFLYRRLDLPPAYDVTFVGQPHGSRREAIQLLRDAGLDVRVWGTGWDTGRLSQEEMIRVFNQSRINLNLPNASEEAGSGSRGDGAGLGRLARSLDAHPAGRRAMRLARPFARRARRWWLRAGRTTDVDLSSRRFPEQIKGRNFEVPGCGGFLLTGRADNIDEYYEDGREIACFETLGELVGEARRYLEAEDERAAVTQAGYERTLAEHTYVHRFGEIFERMGLAAPAHAEVLAGVPRPGETLRIGP